MCPRIWAPANIMRGTATLAALLVVTPALAAGAGRTVSMSPGESACMAAQLARVQRRLASSGSGSLATNLGLNAIWLAASSGDRFAGLARQRDFEGSGYDDFIAGRSKFLETQLRRRWQPRIELADAFGEE